MTLPWYLNPWAEVRRLRVVEIKSAARSEKWFGKYFQEALDRVSLLCEQEALEAENAELRRQIAEMRKGPELRLCSGGNAPDVREALCGCQKCTDARPGLRGWDQPGWRYACEKCGNKRCPHHDWHGFKCTGSNEPDQIGEPG